MRTTRELDNIFDALANPHRREIIYILGLQPSSINHLASLRGLSLPAIHKHIKILERAKLILRKKVGQSNILSLNRESLGSLQDWLTQYQTYWGTPQESLENYGQFFRKESPTSHKASSGERR